MLERDVQEYNGNVRRMLSVCAEFERIAKVVLDKAERDIRGRGKRKQADRERERDRANGGISADLEDGKTLEQIQIETQASWRRPVQTSSLMASLSQPGSGAGASPASWNGSQAGGRGSGAFAGPGAQYFTEQQQRMQPAPHQQPGGQWNVPPFTSGTPNPANFSQAPQPEFPIPGIDSNLGFNPNVPDFQNFNPAYASPGQGGGVGDAFSGSFQQPFVPQDLWQMPMTLEWDWAEGLGMGSFASNGIYGDPNAEFGLGQTGVERDAYGGPQG